MLVAICIEDIHSLPTLGHQSSDAFSNRNFDDRAVTILVLDASSTAFTSISHYKRTESNWSEGFASHNIVTVSFYLYLFPSLKEWGQNSQEGKIFHAQHLAAERAVNQAMPRFTAKVFSSCSIRQSIRHVASDRIKRIQVWGSGDESDHYLRKPFSWSSKKRMTFSQCNRSQTNERILLIAFSISSSTESLPKMSTAYSGHQQLVRKSPGPNCTDIQSCRLTRQHTHLVKVCWFIEDKKQVHQCILHNSTAWYPTELC